MKATPYQRLRGTDKAISDAQNDVDNCAAQVLAYYSRRHQLGTMSAARGAVTFLRTARQRLSALAA